MANPTGEPNGEGLRLDFRFGDGWRKARRRPHRQERPAAARSLLVVETVTSSERFDVDARGAATGRRQTSIGFVSPKRAITILHIPIH